MFCPECGTKNPDGSRFCENCGTALEQVEPKKRMKKQRKPLSKFFMAEVGILVIAIIACVGIYKMNLSPEKVAENYVKACNNGDWNAVYQMSDYNSKGNEFLKKDAYITAKTIAGKSQTKNKVTITSSYKRSGNLNQATVTVRYKDENSDQKQDVKLKKKGLVWKIQPEEDVFQTVKDAQIIVPADAKVSVDKIKLGKDIKDKTKGSKDTYTMPKMFGNTHYIEVTMEGAKDYVKIASLENPLEIIPTYTKDTYKKLSSQAQEDLNKIINAAINDKRYSEIDIFKNIPAEFESDMKENYEKLRDDRLLREDSWERITSYEFYNIEVTMTNGMYSTENAECACVFVTLTGDTKEKHLNKRGEEEIIDSSDVYTLCYEKNEKGWILI